jgi:hypothetical protein
MMPNAPHAVYTPEHAVCHGGHFFAKSTMEKTMFGIIHGLMGGLLLTNTDHHPSWLLLRRIAYFYHDVLVCDDAGRRRLQEDGSCFLNV